MVERQLTYRSYLLRKKKTKKKSEQVYQSCVWGCRYAHLLGMPNAYSWGSKRVNLWLNTRVV